MSFGVERNTVQGGVCNEMDYNCYQSETTVFFWGIW